MQIDNADHTRIRATKGGKLLYAEVTYQIRGACFWVWKEFGSAFKESMVERAMREELKRRGLRVESQKRSAFDPRC